MKLYIISDKAFQTPLYKAIERAIRTYFSQKRFEITFEEIDQGDLDFCMGCFGCWTKKPGECVIPDKMGQINQTFMNSDGVIYLSPVVFGQFSANIKNAIDRWIPNALPFFETRTDGSTMHPPRYASYPKQLIIGYQMGMSEEDAQLFKDITEKHRTNVAVITVDDLDFDLSRLFDSIQFERIGGPL
ncbi:flavodoxin family protein [Fusibacter paucivorans]|uniref:Flavodoxin family protein n=1 Tax=Fusibacter paucivorans TaxID=76009 RepID=A0ABS5PV31_9FIRM|nr:NAD(P)H-dependent oxidoreductase [Fusibacter paucivorans]MBS7527942.1 flavodoxin family protein [Fusibacter paucivorans]